jgi:integrase
MLSVKKVEKLTRPGRYHDGWGLYLQVNRGGAKSWVFRYQRGGRERMLGLGPCHAFSLSEARERARQARQLLHTGADPIDQRRAERPAPALTFREATQRYFDLHRSEWRNAKHAAQFLSSLSHHAFPLLGAMSVAEIATPDVLAAIQPCWTAKAVTMSRVRSRIEAVLDWAKINGYRSGENPARWGGHLDQALPARSRVAGIKHHAALPYAEIGAFVADLRAHPGFAARALEFTILTAARSGEVIGAQWSEVNWAEKTWTIAAERMKGGREHRVPLSPQAVKLLRDLYQENGCGHIFLGARAGGGLSKMAMAVLLERMGRNVTVHGFRSTFRDWAAETTNFPNHVVEMALAHAVGDTVERAYRRGDLFEKRRKLMDAWSVYCDRPRTAGEVVPMRRGAG